MKIAIFLMMIPGIVFSIGAVLLIYRGIDGWGWCIFAAILLCSGVSYKTGNSHD